MEGIVADAISLIAAVIVAFAVTVVFVAILRPVAKSIDLVDKPGGRKNHIGVVPIVGGIAMFAGMIAAFTLLPDGWVDWSAIIAGSAILVIVGVIDDRFHIPAAARLSAQIAVVVLMVYGAGMPMASIGDPFGTGELVMGRGTLLFTMLVTISMINAYNFVDGADGLAGSLALITLLAVADVATIGHPMAAISFVIIAAIIGFLVFNFPTVLNRKARSFMGDAGSTLLGFSIVWVTIGISQGPDRLISPVHCLWFASIPIYDMFTCFVRRLLKRQSPFTPGRDHFHHVLLRGGFGVRKTLAILTGLQLVYVLIGLAGFRAAIPDVVMFWAWAALGFSQIAVISALSRYNRFKRMRAHQRQARIS